MSQCYHHVLELFRRQPQQHLGSVAVEPDWEPALQCLRWEHARHTAGSRVSLDDALGHIEPVYHDELGEPFVRCFQAVLPGEPPGRTLTIPIEYLAPLAKSASLGLVNQGKLQSGEVFVFLVTVYPAADAGQEDSRGRLLRVERRMHHIELNEQTIGALLARSAAQDEPDDEETPLLLRGEALEECAALTRRAGPQETGGLLIGLFHVDPASRRVFVEVTSQIPACGTVQQRDSLAFTPETWEAAEAAIKLRRGREVILGWWHSHPVFAWDGPASGRGRPSPDFFSQRDAALHRTVFCRGYNVALVLTNRGDAGGLSSRLYGWRHGMIARRGFYLLDDTNTEDCN